MGNCSIKKEAAETTSVIARSNFVQIYVIGRGGFGKVWKVEMKKNRQFYAMKEMSKAKIITKRSVNSVINERQLLHTLRHPFLVNMIYAFQDRENLYLVMDLMTGGDIRYHVGKYRVFSEEQTKFFIACIVLALEYMHLNGVIHRDIKPENLVLEGDGYVRVTDLGIARVWRPDNANDTSGTPGYMAPEVMCRQNHGVAVDYYAVGVMGYEFMLGRRPYTGKSRKEIRDQILSKQVQIKRQEIPDSWSLEAADFINRVLSPSSCSPVNFPKLIQRKPSNRLGLNGPSEVKNHPWLRDFPWQKLLTKQLPAPFIPPNKEENFNVKQTVNEDNDPNAELIEQNTLLLRRNSVQALFQGYDYDGTQVQSPTDLSTPQISITQSVNGGFGSNLVTNESVLQKSGVM